MHGKLATMTEEWTNVEDNLPNSGEIVLVLVIKDMGFGLKMSRPDVLQFDAGKWSYMDMHLDIETKVPMMELSTNEKVVKWLRFPHPSALQGMRKLSSSSSS